MPVRQDADRANISTPGGFGDGVAYVIDAAQRGALFLDVMRQRGNQYREHLARIAPHVLEFEAELLVDGRTLDRPVNYVLARIVPPKDLEIDPKRRPFVVIDPRAGHGPGIGGFKADSEIGAAFKAGHPCYLVGFLPEPVAGQTIEDVARAEAVFLQKVIDLHPDADGRPCVVGNCQAGWAVMMLAAIRPELFGPIIVAGSPLSYWGGKRGQNPMRYSGGMLGGSWLTAMISDLGMGKFDGTWLVQNFEKLNPSNTLWSKQYNLYSNIDTEAPRYLGFERWWGGHINLNAEEIQFIVDELFVGNNLAAGRIKTRDGTTIDLRNIRSPIVIFCSKADNITPPGQALGWILDLYEDINEIRSYGQTIVYTVHESIGHLGIFVSAGVARKEHGELSSNIDLIDTLPPGLYEAVFESKEGNTASPDLIFGDWVMRCEERTLDDIRKLGANSVAEDRCFATAARISEVNLSLYRTFMQPMVRAMATPQTAQWMRNAHPLRLQYELFSDANPLMKKANPAVRWAKEHRRPIGKDNSLLRLQETISNEIVSWLDSWRDARDSWTEKTFFTVYGAPAVQAMTGIDPADASPMRKAPKSPLHDEMLQARIAELKSQIPVGGIREATVRALLFVGMPRGAIDERGFEMVRRIRSAKTDIPHLPLDEFKALVRAQFSMLLIDTDASIATIPAMLPPEPRSRLKALELLKQVIGARGEMPAESARRFEQIERLFKAGPNRPVVSPANIEPRGDKRIAS
jgi:pimeloyl-ACP methyl ester carboxylesterase